MSHRILGLLCSLALLSESPCWGSPMQWTVASGGNDHYYDVVVVADQVTWTASSASASSTVFNGRSGFLATITSQAE